jgi:hypothetical protein
MSPPSKVRLRQIQALRNVRKADGMANPLLPPLQPWQCEAPEQETRRPSITRVILAGLLPVVLLFGIWVWFGIPHWLDTKEVERNRQEITALWRVVTQGLQKDDREVVCRCFSSHWADKLRADRQSYDHLREIGVFAGKESQLRIRVESVDRVAYLHAGGSDPGPISGPVWRLEKHPDDMSWRFVGVSMSLD